MVLQDVAVQASSVSDSLSLSSECTFYPIICVFDLTTICMESDYMRIFCLQSQQVVLDVWILHMSFMLVTTVESTLQLPRKCPYVHCTFAEIYQVCF